MTLSCQPARAALRPHRSSPAVFAPRRLAAAMRAALLGLAVGAAALPGLVHAQAAPDAAPAGAETRRFDVPAGPLDAALDRFARIAGVNLSYDPALLDGLSSPGLAGSYSVASALGLLLAGTGIEAVAQHGGYVLRKVAAGSAGALTLPVVTVTGAAEQDASALAKPYAGGQVARGARLGVLGNVDFMDAPFNVTAYTAQVIADQQSATVADVLRNDPSVRYTTSDGHNAENFTIRGFEVNSTELALNGLYGLLPGAHVPTEFLERVEVFKGPAAMLSGIAPSGAVGGVINLVPKRAGDAPVAQVTASYASESRLGLAADVGQRFGEEKRFGIRVNGSYSNGDAALDDQTKRERFASVGIDYRGDRWRLEFDAYSASQNQSNGSPLMVGFGTLGHVIAAPDASNNALHGTFADQDTEGAALRGEVDLDDQWTAYAAVGGAHYRYDGYLNGTRVVVLNDSGSSRGQTYNQGGYTHSVSAEAGVRGNFATGAIGHRVVASVSSLETRTGAGSVANGATYTTNLYNPITNPTLAGAHGAVVKSADNTYTGLSLSDTLAALDEKVLLTLGARAQRVRQTMATPKAYDEDAVTPLAGLVLKPWGPSVSLYANYIEGLSPGVTVGTAYANSGETLAPYKTKQIEVGVKWERGSFTNTFSLFRIEKPSTISIAGSGLPTLALDGEQRNSGLEWNIFGEITPRIRVLGGAAWTHAEQVRASSAANDGKDVAGVPEWTANLGAEWDPHWVGGLTLDARVIYTGAQYLDSANTLEIPSWTRFDVGARYATRILGKPVVFRANIENLADRNYWSGRFNDGYATLSAPRTVKLSATVDF